MKLLLINNEFPPIGGGGSTVAKYAVKYFSEAGHDVTLITSSFRDLPRKEKFSASFVGDGINKGSVTIIRVPAFRRYKDYCSAWELISFGISALFYCLWYVPSQKPDVIHAYFALPAGWVARIIHLIYGTPFSVYFGGSDMPGSNPSRYKKLYPYITLLTRWVWRGASVSTVCSHGLFELGRKLDPKYDFRLVPNGVELSRFVPVERRPNPKVKILFIGRLIARKGFQYVVQALPRIQQITNVPFEVEVVGTGAMRSHLDGLAVKLGVSHLIKYVGTVPYEKLHESYQGADVFVLTSESEGMPAVTLEAMGCGLPIITTNVPGNREIVREGENGYLIDVGDTEKLAQDLAKLIQNEELRKKMGVASRQFVQGYEWREIIKQYENILKEIVYHKKT
jgi:glycosyltransferase involved in cell wall biosynthesis